MHGIRPLIASLLFAVGLISQGARAADKVLEPNEKWVLNYADDSCRLARSFGTGDDKVVLILDQFQPAGVLDMQLVGRRFGRFGGNRIEFSSTFGPGLPAGVSRDALLGTIGPDHTGIIMSGPRDLLNRPTVHKSDDPSDEVFPVTPEQEAAITELRVSASTMRLTLKTGSMKSPLAAMRTCISNLVKDWGLDPAQQDALTRRVVPKGKPSYWLTSADYPAGALARGASAIVRFRMMVDTGGVPTKCYVQQATMSPEFIKLTCDLLMKRARFSPALDAAGKPVASFYTNSVRWLAP